MKLVGFLVFLKLLLLPSLPVLNAVSIVMTMMIRDEEVNLRVNLPLWEPIIEYFVFVLDPRTVDNSSNVIQTILSNSSRYKIYYKEFMGFGPSRTFSLLMAWEAFPTASHVWIADPDWKPDAATIRKEDLNFDADAYRFVIYDRNGETTRRCDWLLRHKPNLKMRYHLHEVLDIGETYRPHKIEWTVHEIEQPGTWHATVGHGSSRTSKRYFFDLELLLKDQAQYSHDAHTHYYLGLTNEAIAERLLAEHTPYHQVVPYLDEAIKYLSLRAKSNYSHEFFEERWSTMMMLGTVYHIKRDFDQAISWYSACRDFSEGNTECAVALTRLYLNTGQLSKASAETHTLLQERKKQRQMLNFYKIYDCDVPALAMEIFVHRARAMPQVFTVDDAKYLFVLSRILRAKTCVKYGVGVRQEILDNVQMILKSQGLATALSRESDAIGLCSDLNFLEYLHKNKYVRHFCSAWEQEQAVMEMCSDFNHDMTAPHEDQHYRSHRDYLGALSIPDIVHHLFTGDASSIFSSSRRSFRVLFAKDFHPRLLYFFLGYINRNRDLFQMMNCPVEIVIFHPDSSALLAIQSVIRSCRFPTAELNIRIQFQVGSIVDSSRVFGPSSFDYIEFNSRITTRPLFVQELHILNSVLKSDGILGLSVFAKNKFVEELRKLFSHQNVSEHLPFSSEPKRLVEEYLEVNQLEVVKKDQRLVEFLSSCGSDNTMVLSQSQLHNLLTGVGLSIRAWFPTGFSHPFEELQSPMVQRFRSLGLNQEDFVETMVPSFRHIVYITKSSYPTPGRLHLINRNLADENDTTVIDRSGLLGTLFSSALEVAKAQQSLAFSVGFYTNPLMKIDHLCMPISAPAMSLLQSKPTIKQLIEFNELHTGRSVVPEDRPHVLSFLSHSLSFLEKTNLITLWKIKTPSQRQSTPHSSPSTEDGKQRNEGVRHVSETAGNLLRAAKFSDDQILLNEKYIAEWRVKSATYPEPAPDISSNDKLKSSVVQPTDSESGVEEKSMRFHLSSSAATKKADEPGASSYSQSSPDNLDNPLSMKTVTINEIGDDTVALGSERDNHQLSLNKTTVKYQSLHELKHSFRSFSWKGKRLRVKLIVVKAIRRGSHQVGFPPMDIMYHSNAICHLAIPVTSLSKLQFDLAQLRYIAYRSPSQSAHLVQFLIPRLQELSQRIKFAQPQLSRDKVIILTRDQLKTVNGELNRLIRLAEDPVFFSPVMLPGAVKSLQRILQQDIATHDFVALDFIFDPRNTALLASTLLSSTIWFDVTNGASFAAHADESLVHNSFKELSKEVEKSVSKIGLQITRYFAISMDLGVAGTSATSIADSSTGEAFAIVIWINDFAPDANNSDSSTNTRNDGLKIFGKDLALLMRSRGVFIRSHVNPDFLSNSAHSLAVEDSLSLLCRVDAEDSNFDIIPRIENRMVIIGADRAFHFVTPGYFSQSNQPYNSDYEKQTVLAVVMIMGYK